MKMKKKINRLVSGLMVIILMFTTILANSNLISAEPTDTSKFIKIPSESEFKKGNTLWINKIDDGGYSSFASEKSKALVVDKAYGYKLYKTDETDFKVTKGDADAVPSSFNGEDLALNESAKKFKWFRTSKNSAGDIEVKITNMKIYQPDKERYIKVSTRATIAVKERNPVLKINKKKS